MYPNALNAGISKFDFFHSTLNDVMLMIQSKNNQVEEKIKFVEYQCWLTGVYIQHTLACAFKKSYKYPENPIAVANKSTKEIAKKTKKSEQELAQEEAYMSLRVKQANANIAKIRENLKIDNKFQDGEVS